MAECRSHSDGQCDLKTSGAQGVDTGQEGEGSGSHQQGNADVHPQQQREATFTERQPPEMQMVLEGKASRYA